MSVYRYDNASKVPTLPDLREGDIVRVAVMVDGERIEADHRVIAVDGATYTLRTVDPVVKVEYFDAGPSR